MDLSKSNTAKQSDETAKEKDADQVTNVTDMSTLTANTPEVVTHVMVNPATFKDATGTLNMSTITVSTTGNMTTNTVIRPFDDLPNLEELSAKRRKTNDEPPIVTVSTISNITSTPLSQPSTSRQPTVFVVGIY